MTWKGVWKTSSKKLHVIVMYVICFVYFFCIIVKIEDEIDRQKAQVTSTLDRLARQVAVAKKERAEKCKAFKVRTKSSNWYDHHISHCSLLCICLLWVLLSLFTVLHIGHANACLISGEANLTKGSWTAGAGI